MSLAQFAGAENLNTAARASLIANALQSSGVTALRLVFGAGLATSVTEIETGLTPIVLVNSGMVKHPAGRTALVEVQEALQIVAHAVGEGASKLLSGVQAWVMPPPEPQLEPGNIITSPARGTIGCPASWSSASGFLTAGHVAVSKGNDVFGGPSKGPFGSSPKIGNVIYASNPRNTGTAPMADIGVIEFAAGKSFVPLLQLSGTTQAPPNGSVIIHARSRQKAIIMGYCSYVFLPTLNGCFGDAYFTTQNVTTGGDSGAATYSGTKAIGLVVAGTAGFTTYVQDINYVLAQSATQTCIAGISV